MSAESGITTFRDAGGLWEQYPVMQVASAEGFAADPALVHRFYNERRAQLRAAAPNEGHRILAELQNRYNVQIITQNIDNLHEAAGSANVLHLHGELMKMRAVADSGIIEPVPDSGITTPDTIGRCGLPMRPHIVFFGEPVPNISPAMDLAARADIFVIIGTSLQVYPAAGLLGCVPHGTPVYYIDPNPAPVPAGVHVIPLPATEGCRRLKAILEEKYPSATKK